jgi:hypothetical protein
MKRNDFEKVSEIRNSRIKKKERSAKLKYRKKNRFGGTPFFQRFSESRSSPKEIQRAWGALPTSKSGGVFAAGPHLTGKMPRLPVISGIPDIICYQ